jgi:hypothetical protein
MGGLAIQLVTHLSLCGLASLHRAGRWGVRDAACGGMGIACRVHATLLANRLEVSGDIGPTLITNDIWGAQGVSRRDTEHAVADALHHSYDSVVSAYSHVVEQHRCGVRVIVPTPVPASVLKVVPIPLADCGVPEEVGIRWVDVWLMVRPEQWLRV